MRFAALLLLLFSVGSLFSSRLGVGEIYPFFHWKLYTSPNGDDNLVQEYRLYCRADSTRPWGRIEMQETELFTRSEFVYSFNALAKQLRIDKTSLPAKTALLVFAEQLDICNQGSVALFSETYNPLKIAQMQQYEPELVAILRP